jgi:hypothetical protein
VEQGLVQVAEGTVLGELASPRRRWAKGLPHDGDALLGAQPPPFVGCVHCAPFIAPHGMRGSLIIGE